MQKRRTAAGKGLHMSKKYHTVLTIAGSDSGGGAGIQADLKTFSALGCYGMSAVTALTAQNTVGVQGIFPIDPIFVADQMDAVFSDMGADAVKIGMLFSAELIEAVAERLDRHAARNIVVDPVMVAQSGDKLLRDDAIDAIKACLFPAADIITPNLPEAEVLLNRSLPSREALRKAAADLSQFGCRHVLIKGGHSADACSEDLLYSAERQSTLYLPGERIETQNNHGTGCTLSSAIAAMLASGRAMAEAVEQAKAFVTEAIRAGAGYQLGRGHGPVHHFFRFWD